MSNEELHLEEEYLNGLDTINEEDNLHNFKNILFEFIEEFNKQDTMFKITYYDIYYDTYYLYIEDVENEIEYQSENNIDSFKNCETRNDYKKIMLEILERDLNKFIGDDK